MQINKWSNELYTHLFDCGVKLSESIFMLQLHYCVVVKCGAYSLVWKRRGYFPFSDFQFPTPPLRKDKAC